MFGVEPRMTPLSGVSPTLPTTIIRASRWSATSSSASDGLLGDQLDLDLDAARRLAVPGLRRHLLAELLDRFLVVGDSPPHSPGGA